MVRYSEKGFSYSAAFFMLIALGIGGNILGGVLGIPIVAAISGKSIVFITEHLDEIMGNPNFFREMQVLQTISAIFGFLLPTIYTASKLSLHPLQTTGLKGTITNRQLLLAIFIIGSGMAISASLGYFTYKLPFPVNWRIQFDQMENNYAEAASGLVNLSSMPELIISIIVLALVPAVCEEVFFRGGLQNYLYKSSGKFWLSVIIVSLIFSAVHFSIYGFLSRVALGIILGLLFQYSGRLWPGILAHFFNNAAAVIAMYVQRNNGKSMQEILSDRTGTYWGLLALPLLVYLFTQYRNISTPNLKPTNGV